MNKVLWNHSECAYCGKNIEAPEEMDGSILITIPAACRNCGKKNYDNDSSFRICSECHFLACDIDGESDENLIEMGILKAGETRTGKIKELELAFEKRTGRKPVIGL